MRRSVAAAMTLALAALVLPTDADAQVDVGVQASFNSEPAGLDDNDGAFGVGARIGINLPIIGLGVLGTGDIFFPDCDPDCDFWDVSGNLTYTFPLVALDPYIGAGVALQSFELEGFDSEEEVGGNLFAGVKVGALLPVQLFGELKYQIFGEPFDDQFVVSVGILF